MDLKIKPISPLARANKFPQEKELMLMKYQGIFKNNISEFAEMIKPKLKKKKNYSR